jgi:hypothetical protein
LFIRSSRENNFQFYPGIRQFCYFSDKKMKYVIIVGLLVAACFPVFGQKQFQTGYYIDNSGHKVTGKIHIPDLVAINRKGVLKIILNDDQRPSEVLLSDIVEVATGNDVKLHKYTVLLDDTNYYTIENTDRYQNLKSVTAFLNVLVEGTASLLAYESSNGPKFFFLKKDMLTPEQLTYKKYIENHQERENTDFRKQIYEKVHCPDQEFTDFSKLGYRRNELVAVFEHANDCSSSKSTIFKNEVKASSSAFTISAGVSQIMSRMAFKGTASAKASSTSYVGGIETCFKRKDSHMGAVLKLEIEHAEGGASLSPNPTTGYTYSFSTNSFNLGIGGSYFLTPETGKGFFAGVQGGFSLPSGFSKVSGKVYNANGTLVGFITEASYYNKPALYVNFSVGYNFTKRIGLAVVYDTPKRVCKENMTTSYSKLAVAFRYSFFD